MWVINYRSVSRANFRFVPPDWCAWFVLIYSGVWWLSSKIADTRKIFVFFDETIHRGEGGQRGGFSNDNCPPPPGKRFLDKFFPPRFRVFFSSMKRTKTFFEERVKRVCSNTALFADRLFTIRYTQLVFGTHLRTVYDCGTDANDTETLLDYWSTRINDNGVSSSRLNPRIVSTVGNQYRDSCNVRVRTTAAWRFELASLVCSINQT